MKGADHRMQRAVQLPPKALVTYVRIPIGSRIAQSSNFLTEVMVKSRDSRFSRFEIRTRTNLLCCAASHQNESSQPAPDPHRLSASLRVEMHQPHPRDAVL